MNQHYYNPVEEGFKKIQYNRYADDFVIGVIGSKKGCRKNQRRYKNLSPRKTAFGNVRGKDESHPFQ